MFGKGCYSLKKCPGVLALVCCLLLTVTATALAANQEARWRRAAPQFALYDG